MYQPTLNGYYSGAGLLEIGLMEAGVKVQRSSDLDPVATQVMKDNPKYFNHPVITEDMTQITVTDQPDADIFAFTYPCTKYSAIGDIHGVRTGDEQFLHALRHVALKQPESYIAENVPGMMKFKVVMEVLTKLPQYYVHVFCPVNASNWLPQERKRLIVIATKRPFNIAAPRPDNRIRLKDIMEKDPEVDMPEYVISRINGKYRDKPIICNPDDVNALAPTCVAHYAKDLGTRLVKDINSKHGVRPFSIREYARLQGVPDDYVFPEKRSSYKLIGNGVPVPMGRWIGQQLIRYFN
jgi:DNA (cytosine-5)-methyltransferase 1